uniref:Retrotransposon protein, putative, Ty3-gypsy subclass n=2 Tax=Oryza sativa subsp. japonica TaxID=39947 RepID=Q75HB9_ORYSJ|nr:retrotransposon protein, putative, Ty3-gypsy sub-class [Oryza sativa Japonica Group]ABF96952.1 retrotransposon protein, putative, Ty3-gypsy subclass [Oryza sativa Japonica Group]
MVVQNGWAYAIGCIFAAWLTEYVIYSPCNHSSEEEFYSDADGLDKESAFYLDITTGGSFMPKTPSEGKKWIEEEEEMQQAEVWACWARPGFDRNMGLAEPLPQPSDSGFSKDGLDVLLNGG